MKMILSDRDLELSLPDKVEFIDLSTKKIATCLGCFNCWVKTPGKCIIRDDATKVYPKIAQSDNIIYISKVKYGSYDLTMKTMLERAIPIQQAFIRLHNNETHHVQRNVALKKAIIIAYGDISNEEKQIFSMLVDRNSHNMNFESHKIIFTSEDDLANVVESEILKWKK